MNQAYVATCSGTTLNELNNLLKSHSFCYFLRWPHDVSGIIERPELLKHDLGKTTEGQAFNYAVELRWKRNGDCFDLLWLGSEAPTKNFDKLPGDWTYEDQKAVLYKTTETRLPKIVKVPTIRVGQRYFRDRQTAVVHFVALRIYQDARP